MAQWAHKDNLARRATLALLDAHAEMVQRDLTVMTVFLVETEALLDTAVVNSSGELLLSLSTGEILNVGRAVGPRGATGETWSNRATWTRLDKMVLRLSCLALRAPTQDDGK